MFSTGPLISLGSQAASYHLRTLLLFTYTDYKTIFFPITFFALANAPLKIIENLCPALLWIWIHQLHIDVSNQYRGLTEDKVNRPWRPLPSGRISAEQAAALRYLLIPSCFVLSAQISPNAVAASLWLTLAFFLYDDVGLANQWYSKNLMNSVGYFGFEYGATCIMAGPDVALRPEALLSLITSPLIILTTVHAQDFSDIEGDKALGRSTLPILFPTLSKLLVCTGVPMWTWILLAIWRLDTLPAIGLNLLACTIAYRFYIAQTSKEYSSSYMIYNLWLLTVHILPSIGYLAK